jgi:hypothetical protein
MNESELATAELYDPASAAFFLTSSMDLPRFDPTVVTLGNGSVLVTGGRGVSAGWETSWTSAELYH